MLFNKKKLKITGKLSDEFVPSKIYFCKNQIRLI